MMARWEPVYPQQPESDSIPEEPQPSIMHSIHQPKAQARHHHHSGTYQKPIPTLTTAPGKPAGHRRSAKPPAAKPRPAPESKHTRSPTSVRHLHNTNVPTAVAEGKITHEVATGNGSHASPTSHRAMKAPDIAFLARVQSQGKSTVRRISSQQPERNAQAKLELAKKRRQELQNLTTETAMSSARGPESLTNSEPPNNMVMPAPVLPFTWKYTSSGGPSSLEAALEAAAGELEKPALPLADLSNLPDDRTRSQSKAAMEKPTPTSRQEDEAPNRASLCQQLEEAESARKLYNQSHDAQAEPREARSPTSNMRSKSTANDNHKIDDRAVLRGLRIAISAACDEEVDAWICQETGVQIRRFLADLKQFETLGERKRPVSPREDGARARRAQLRKLKAQIRKSRLAMKEDGASPEK